MLGQDGRAGLTCECRADLGRIEGQVTGDMRPRGGVQGMPTVLLTFMPRSFDDSTRGQAEDVLRIEDIPLSEKECLKDSPIHGIFNISHCPSFMPPR